MYRHMLPFRQIPLYCCFLHWYHLPFSHLCITMLVYDFFFSLYLVVGHGHAFYSWNSLVGVHRTVAFHGLGGRHILIRSF